MRPGGEGTAPPALLVVDVQIGLDDPVHGRRNNPGAESNIARLLAAWRAAGVPVVHVQHHSIEPGSTLRPEAPGCEVKPEARPVPGEKLFRKHTNSAFVGTDLEAHLRGAGIDSLVVAGLTTDHCVSSTVRAAADLGFSVAVVHDATACHERLGHDGRIFEAQLVHELALAHLRGEFARILTTEEAIGQLRGVG
ncbi:MAG: cysteine hydrolase [Acidobacteria bacterium]|nr:MAG: cysteine hydrolase [Acidobacteriota bacterium]REK08783.1 MAG: cysteine hydrolase [Acidobacteriota bacterium]